MASVMLFVLLSLAFSGAFTLWSEPEPGMCEWSMAGWNRVEASLEGVPAHVYHRNGSTVYLGVAATI
jgi:hypothetical protein